MTTNNSGGPLPRGTAAKTRNRPEAGPSAELTAPRQREHSEVGYVTFPEPSPGHDRHARSP